MPSIYHVKLSHETMLLQPLVVSLLATLNFSQGLQTKSEITTLVKDFLQLQDFPIKVNAFVCWSKGDTKNFLKTLSSRYHTSLLRFDSTKLFYALPEHQVFFLDLTCNCSVKILELAAKSKLFNAPFTWLIFGSSPVFNDFYIGLGSKTYLIDKNQEGLYDIKSIYKYTKNSTKIMEDHVATWGRNEKFLVYNKLIVPRNRSSLNGEKIMISYVITNLDTLNHLWDYRHKQIDAITKLNYILVHHLADYLNASKEFIMQRTWGYKNSTTGIYSGVVGDLQLEIADLGGTPMFFTQDRVDVLDYIAATTPTFIKFIFRAPPLSYVTNVFTLPFDTTVWHCCFLMVAVIALVVYIIVLWEWQDPKFRSKLEETPNTLRPNIFDVVMMDIGAISQQGTDVEPKSNAGRIATIFTFLTLMFFYTSYSANVVALLQSTTDSIKTLEDLLNSRIKLGVEDIVYEHYYFENARDPVRKAIYEQKIAPKGQKPNFMTAEEGIKRVQEGFFGFHTELTTGYKVVGDIFQENEKCSLKEIVFVNLIEPWITTQKNSPYKEVMKIGMKKIHESGVQQREVRRIYTRKPVCHSKGSNFGSVGLIDCYSAFLIFATGVAIGVIMLIVEIGAERCFKRETSDSEAELRDSKASEATASNRPSANTLDLEFTD